MRKKTLLDAAEIEAASRLKKIWDEKKITLRLTQEKAADALGFSTQATVSHYLNGTMPLNTDATLKFAALLGVKPEAIRPDLTDMMNYIRRSGSHSDDYSAPGWRLLKPEYSELLDLYERLPQSEKEKHLSELKEKVLGFDRLFEELLAARKQ
ncbi:helix-turn-helix domain-containing protein [Serratia grimesii]|uniref:helix-turn-helix domain-containing protein n=1 Tax=Serratia grimesii TaxID=82995 RepID=UPI00077C1CEE|nr:helix-turn-helix domain-containing protein [Serratia grimesii]CAI0728609.1 transcriptional repressor DicA [Serratia grimesii]CAI2444985.1 transcriptional repressor DicA [Serratia grimesii]SUI32668.1 transcriptional repressor DicA [Serratia grimesii]